MILSIQVVEMQKKVFTEAFKSVHSPHKKCSRREHFLLYFDPKQHMERLAKPTQNEDK
jgi:hypothetical protein